MTDNDAATGPGPIAITDSEVQPLRRSRVWDDRIRLERGLRGWTQRELAIVAGISQAQVARLERGARHIEDHVLVRVAEAFVIPPAELFPLDKTSQTQTERATAAAS